MKQLYATLVAGILPLLSLAQYNKENLKLADSNGDSWHSAYVEAGNLRIYPIYASQQFTDSHRDMGKFSTLRQAQEKNQVVITEHVAGGYRQSLPALDNAARQQITLDSLVLDSMQRAVETPNENRDGSQQIAYQWQTQGLSLDNNAQMANWDFGSTETVNTLYIENISPDTVYIMAGEVVKGGKQDRMIAQDMILPPNSGKIDISVFCVEHGRWTYENGGNANGDTGNAMQFTSAKYVAPLEVRKAMELEKNQSAVWGSVSQQNTTTYTVTTTDALTAMEDNDSLQNKLKTYLDNPALRNLPAQNSQMVGIIAVTGDSVIGCDIFATPSLFADHYELLLNSYATHAAINGKPATLADAEVGTWLNRFLIMPDVTQSQMQDSGVVNEFEINGKKVKTRVSKY